VVKDGKSIVMNEIRCIKCGHCVAICPVDAINHDKINFEDGKLINDNMHIEYEHLLDFVRKRRSIRQYLDKPIEKEKLKKLLDIARYSPSAKNSQDFEFVVIQDKEKINNYL
jgi:formate hydrogenlyase subunit 6/NADH:ubiquinone oxidoreductase subunit I